VQVGGNSSRERQRQEQQERLQQLEMAREVHTSNRHPDGRRGEQEGGSEEEDEDPIGE
jgi:hypothetical protein